MAIVGILGGMGPMATVDVFQKIVSQTPAQCDQDHFRIIIDNNPLIPPRTQAILGGGESPLPELIRSAKGLESCGVHFIIMPCNTAHYWFHEIQQAITIPLIHMIDNAVEYIRAQHQEAAQKIMLLATTGTVQTGLYGQAFSKHGLELLYPSAEDQELIANVIEEIKAGHIANNSYRDMLNSLMNRYAEQGIDAFIGGCTEIPLIFPYVKGNFITYDPTDLLALRAIYEAMRIRNKTI